GVLLAGVGVGVAALIVILSVMNGFDSELRSRRLALSAPVRITAPGGVPDCELLAGAASAAVPERLVGRHADLQVPAWRQPETLALVVRGADGPTREGLAGLLVQGSLEALEGGDAVVLGVLAADRLGVLPGDVLRLLVPVMAHGAPEFRMRQFAVARSEEHT